MNKDCGCLVVDLETDELVRAPLVDVDLHRFKCSVCGMIGFLFSTCTGSVENRAG